MDPWCCFDITFQRMEDLVRRGLLCARASSVAPLPKFTGRLIEESPEQWRKWGILEKDKKKI